MPQLFQVLKCYKCSVFQVHQTKKSNKWQCKLCGEKQSIKRHYGLGTGKECRLHVQKLNGIRSEIDELSEFNELSNNGEEELEMENENSTHSMKTSSHILDKALTKNESKWSNFIDKTELVQETDTNENVYLANTEVEVVLEVPTKKRRKFKTPTVYSSNHKSKLTETIEPEYQQKQIYCEPDLFQSSSNTFSNARSSKMIKNTTFSKSKVLEKQNYFTMPKTENYNPGDINEKTTKETRLLNETPTKNYFPPKVNKYSKWAQFTEEPDEKKEALSFSRENSWGNLPNKLFALCDENELDDVLDL